MNFDKMFEFEKPRNQIPLSFSSFFFSKLFFFFLIHFEKNQVWGIRDLVSPIWKR